MRTALQSYLHLFALVFSEPVKVPDVIMVGTGSPKKWENFIFLIVTIFLLNRTYKRLLMPFLCNILQNPTFAPPIFVYRKNADPEIRGFFEILKHGHVICYFAQNFMLNNFVNEIET